jgi:transposase
MTHWTPELIAEVQALRAIGMSYGKIGKRMGLSKNSVIAADRRDRFPPPSRRKVRPARDLEHEQRMAAWQRQHDGAIHALEMVKRPLTDQADNR